MPHVFKVDPVRGALVRGADREVIQCTEKYTTDMVCMSQRDFEFMFMKCVDDDRSTWSKLFE